MGHNRPPQRNTPIRVILVEDHEIVRVALRVLLERTEAIQVVAEAGTAAGGFANVRKHEPDVVLVDVKLPDWSGVELCREIRRVRPETRVIFLTAFPDDDTLLACVSEGAHGYLHKTAGFETVLEAIKTVAAGRFYLDHATVGSVLTLLRAAPLPPEKTSVPLLSPQERRVIALIADGRTNKEIATSLHLSEKTVKNYLHRAYQKLSITRRAQAAALFVKAGSTTQTSSFPDRTQCAFRIEKLSDTN